MKKIMIVATAIVFALTLGVAYAGDMSSDMSKWDNNGITIFANGPVTTGTDFRSGSLELASELVLSHPEELASDNGATVFAYGPVSTEMNYKGGEIIKGEEGMAAGGYEGVEAPALDLHNGVTVFDRGPIEAD